MEATKSFVEVQNENPNRQEEPKKRNRKRLCSDRQKCIMFLLFISASMVIPLLMYFITTSITIEQDITSSCAVDDSFKIPCGRTGISITECFQIHGCFDDFTLSCYHYMPAKYNYYINEDNVVYDSLQTLTPFGNISVPQLKLSVVELDSNRVQVVLHHPSLLYTSTTLANKTYFVKKDDRILGVEIFKQSDKHLILSTLRGPLIASSHYWEWSVYLPAEHLFGLGELILPKNETLTKIIYKNKNDHTTLPNLMGYLNGSFYGILFEHDGPLEITILPAKIVILKSLAGDRIAINVYMGPTLKNVIDQMRNNLVVPSVPYWTLGVHICRDGLTNIEQAINEFIEFHQANKDIRYASDCIHENLYNMLYQLKGEQNLKESIEALQQNSTRFLMTIPPQVIKMNTYLYNAAVELNILYNNSEGGNFVGNYQNQAAVFPDYTHPSIEEWFKTLKNYSIITNSDGFVLKDNWPNEDSYIFYDQDFKFPYMTDNINQSLSNTIPWNATGVSQQPHILHHNSYGDAQLTAFRNFMQYEFVLTSAFSSGTPESILIQNVNASWSNLKKTVTSTLYNSLFGKFLMSVPVCGSTSYYNNQTNDELCLRWYITAATLPLLRISSDFPRRDPSNLSSGFSKNVVKDALKKRYALLPYYYSTLSNGDPLVRPMIYNFNDDNVTWTLDEQYMVGDALLVAQPFVPSLTNLNIYLPPKVPTWYEFWGGSPYSKPGWINLNLVKSDWVMFIAEGHIIPIRHYNNSDTIGEYSPDDSFGFAVALNCTVQECFAEGSLYFTSTQLNVTANRTGMSITNVCQVQEDIGCTLPEPTHPKYISNVLVYGLSTVINETNFEAIDLCTAANCSLYIPYF